MAFYKLFYIVHRRTDWYRLWQLERQVMMPEWYEERKKQAELVMKKLAICNALVNYINTSYK